MTRLAAAREWKYVLEPLLLMNDAYLVLRRIAGSCLRWIGLRK